MVLNFQPRDVVDTHSLKRQTHGGVRYPTWGITLFHGPVQVLGIDHLKYPTVDCGLNSNFTRVYVVVVYVVVYPLHGGLCSPTFHHWGSTTSYQRDCNGSSPGLTWHESKIAQWDLGTDIGKVQRWGETTCLWLQQSRGWFINFMTHRIHVCYIW